jgi:hypothetical protein
MTVDNGPPRLYAAREIAKMFLAEPLAPPATGYDKALQRQRRSPQLVKGDKR